MTLTQPKPTQSLNQWHLMFFSIYGDRNSDRDQFKLFAHLVEVAGGFSKVVRKGTNLADIKSFLGKLFGWYSALALRLGYRDIESIVWTKYPYVCPYCGHSNCKCDPERPPSVLANNTLNRFRHENRERRPARLSEWQSMFLNIYGKQNRVLGSSYHDSQNTRSQLLIALNRLSEELGELAEAIRLEHKYAIGISSELADVFGWIMAAANVLPEHLNDSAFSLEDTLWSQYPGYCSYCFKRRCSCPNDRVRRSLLASAGQESEHQFDELSGLLRKDAFERDLSESVVFANADRPLNLLILDLDHFKKVNDKFGHSFGDEVIRAAADIFSHVASSYSANVYRWGGEEFTVILPERSTDEARICAGRMLAELREKPFPTQQGEHRQTASVGIATLFGSSGQGTSVVTRELFNAADKALYNAKESGRDRVVTVRLDEVSFLENNRSV